jgi:hypothetical protein
LDITAKEVLEEALLHYAGAVVLVSHDRYFMSQVANTILSFQDKHVRRFDCDYRDHLELLEREAKQRAEEEVRQKKKQLEKLKLLLESSLSTVAGAVSTGASSSADRQHQHNALRSWLDEMQQHSFPADVFDPAPATAAAHSILAPGPSSISSSSSSISSSSTQQEEAADSGIHKFQQCISTAVAAANDALEELYNTEGGLGSDSSAGTVQKLSLKAKVMERNVDGDKYRITNAKKVLVDFNAEDRKSKTKRFGGSGVTCGNLYKGIKNAKRYEGRH